MSYQQKRILVIMLTSGIILVAYCVQALEKYRSVALENQSMREWAGLMLFFVAVGIAVTIATQVLFHIVYSIAIAAKVKITQESASDEAIERKISNEFIEDERDKLIELKSTQVGFAIAGVGFVSGLGYMYFQGSPVLMLNIMFLSLLGGSLVEAAVQLYLHRVS